MFNTKQSAFPFSKYVSDPSKYVVQNVVVQMFIFISGLSRLSTLRCLLLWFNVLLMKVDWLSTFISKADNLLNWLGLYQCQTGSARESKGRPVTKVTTPTTQPSRTAENLLRRFAWHHSSASLWSRLRATHLRDLYRYVISALVNKWGDKRVCSSAWVWIRHLFHLCVGFAHLSISRWLLSSTQQV